MNVRNEINKYALEKDKPALLYLFSRYHWQSQWNFVAKCTFEGRSPGARRVWSPTAEGTILYEHALSTKEFTDCPACGGRGFVITGVGELQCNMCSGRGLVRSEQSPVPSATCNWCRMAADPNNASVTACPFHIVSLASETVNYCVPVNGIHASFCTGHKSEKK